MKVERSLKKKFQRLALVSGQFHRPNSLICLFNLCFFFSFFCFCLCYRILFLSSGVRILSVVEKLGPQRTPNHHTSVRVLCSFTRWARKWSGRVGLTRWKNQWKDQAPTIDVKGWMWQTSGYGGYTVQDQPNPISFCLFFFPKSSDFLFFYFTYWETPSSYVFNSIRFSPLLRLLFFFFTRTFRVFFFTYLILWFFSSSPFDVTKDSENLDSVARRLCWLCRFVIRQHGLKWYRRRRRL